MGFIKWVDGWHTINSVQYQGKKYSLVVSVDMFGGTNVGVIWMMIVKGEVTTDHPDTAAMVKIEYSDKDPFQLVEEKMKSLNEKIGNIFGDVKPETWWDKVMFAIQQYGLVVKEEGLIVEKVEV